MTWPELWITAELSDALGWVLGAAPSTPEPVVVVAASLDLLAKGYGLSESGLIDWDPLEHADLPAPAVALIHHLFAADAPELRADTLRDGVYGLLVGLAQDRDARRKLNMNNPMTEVELLTAGQIYWNLEGRGARTRLPLQRGPITVKSRSGSKQLEADIKVPNENKDFATMRWTARVNQKGPHKSSGQGFRNQGARLAVLAAQLITRNGPHPLPDLEGAVLHHTQDIPSTPRITSITWPDDEPAAASPIAAQPDHAPASAASRAVLPDRPRAAQPPERPDTQRVLVGAPAEVGADYQPRGFDVELDRLWADTGDRRIWLRGGPGLGKSYSARRVMQEAVVDQARDRAELLIWVDSADAASVTDAFSSAVDQLRQHGFAVPGGAQDPADRKARALLGLLATSTLGWLIVLDDADAGSLMGARLIPPGGNLNGRVLLTTRSRDPRIATHGREAHAALFSQLEAEAYLRGDALSEGHGRGSLATVDSSTADALATAVGHHPLALSVAAATIIANAMTVTDWIEEFTAAGPMDTAADEPDRGGYPHLIGATWRVTLGKASEGLPEGVVERAAMVAAVQDPDGHPTWLWDRDAVTNWVAGGEALARRHRVPVAVQRLIDHGIVQLRGQTWRDGQVTIHQLAARAIREAAAPVALADLAGILGEQWLLEVTRNPSAAQPDMLRRSLRPIAALPDLPTPARSTVTALLAYRQPDGAGAARTFVETLEPHTDRGGTTVRLELAGELLDLADKEASLGRPVQARAGYIRAADLYRQLVEDRSLHDDELAACLMRLGDVEGHLGNPEQARASRQRAAGLLERLAATASDTGTISRYLARLVTLHDLLGNHESKARALVRAEALVARPPDDLPSSAQHPDVRREGYTWRTLAGLMRQAGRLGTAKECLAREAALYERFPESWRFTDSAWTEAVQELALLHAQTGEWSDAERLLTSLTDITQMPRAASVRDEKAERVSDANPRLPGLQKSSQRDTLVLLASVQTHLGRHEDAVKNLALAAEQYREHPIDQDRSDDDWLASLAEEDRELMKEIQEEEKAFRRVFETLTLDRLVAESTERGRWEEAVGLSGSLLDLAQQGAAGAPGDAEAEEALASAHEVMGLALHGQGAWDDAEVHFTRAVSILQMLAELDPSRADAQRSLARALVLQATCFDSAGHHQACADSRTRAVSAYRRVAELAPNDSRAATDLARMLDSLAMKHAGLGNVDQAVGCHEESISILSKLTGQTPDDHTVQSKLADALVRFGWTLMSQGRPEAAVEPLRRAHDTYLFVVTSLTPEDHQARRELARTHALLGLVLNGTGRPEDALLHCNEAVTAYRALADHAPNDRETQNGLATALALLGGVHEDIGQQEQAADYLTRSANILQLLADLDPDNRPDVLIAVLNELARILRFLGRTDEADVTLARAADLAHKYPDEDAKDDQ